jgi:transmembrane protein EpsG
MFIYNLICVNLLISFLLSLITRFKQFNVFFYVFNFLSILFLRSLRFETGTDWIPYLDFFLDQSVNDFEFGFYLFNSLIRTFSDSYTIYLFVFNFIILILTVSAAKKFKINNHFFLLFYFLSLSIFPLRQHLAGALLFYAIGCFNLKNIAKGWLFVIFSISIHYSSLIFLPLLLIFNKKINNKLIIYIILFFSLLYYNFDSLVSIIFSGQSNTIFKKIIFYTKTSEQSTAFSFFVLLKGLLLIISYRYILKENKNYVVLNSFYYFLFFNVLFSNIFFELGRFASLFYFAEIIILWKIYENLKYRFSPNVYKILNMLIPLFLLTYSYLKYYNLFYLNEYRDLYVPYISVFDGINRTYLY